MTTPDTRAKELAAELRHIAAHANPPLISLDRDALTETASLIERLCQERDEARAIASRVREIVQDVWDKKPGYTDRQAWSDLHGQAMNLLSWDVKCDLATRALAEQPQ